MTLQVIFEPLEHTHDRSPFRCDVPLLDRYFREQVGQDLKRRLANCFVAVHVETKAVAGFYTLSASSISFDALPESEVRRLPRYPALPAVLIGRLAVDLRYRGHGIGTAMIVDALRRCANAAPAAFALLVDAKDEGAVRFYQRHGFVRLVDRKNALFLSIGTALKVLGGH